MQVADGEAEPKVSLMSAIVSTPCHVSGAELGIELVGWYIVLAPSEKLCLGPMEEEEVKGACGSAP